MSADQWWQILGLAVLFVFSAFFSGSETALMAIDRLRVRYLAEKGRPGASRLEALLEKPESLLSAILIGNNLVNIMVSVFATALFIELFSGRGELMTILILTPILLIFAEILPKTLAANYPEPVSFAVLHPIRLVMWLLKPVIVVVGGLSRFFARLFRGDEERPLISEDEIRSIIEFGEQSGVVHTEKRRMLHGIFDLGQMRVRDVMVPRTEVVGIEVDTPFSELVSLCATARHSRFPVYAGALDRVVGIIHSKDVLSYLDRPEEFSLRTVARPPYFVPEAKPIESLLQAFRRKRLHLAVVVDEYGGVEGIVTLEDIVEEIVGEIQDEYDDEEVLIQPIGPNRFLVDGSATLRSINRRFDLALSEEHVNTLAGFMMHSLGSIPEVGDVCEVAGLRCTVREVEDRRIETIELELLTPPAD
ncbi:MAG: CNNM domain-containing protein [Desulfuromonadales bacterium]|nr:CNNM domain-containing protein [Desulfuromonadales bacterium]